MTQPESTAPAPNGPWPVLDAKERRVLGVLVEKAKTTPDAYPMSLNALVTGCNQKSNREPVMFLSEDDVEYTLTRLQKGGLVVKITGGRVERWRHTLYDTWNVDKVEIAILGELLLRGPQTEGELRTRASRMEPIDDLDHLRRLLRPLVERNLVVYLTPEDRRGAVLTHGFHDPRERDQLRAPHAAEPVPVSAPPSAPTPAPVAQPTPSRADSALPQIEAALAEAKSEIAALKATVAALEANLAAVQTELREFKASLGA
jgi:uncharacterized protein YceH (UPF0502 family)